MCRTPDVERCQGDRRGGVATNGLGEHMFASGRRQLLLQRIGLLGVGDGPNVVRGYQRMKASDSLLKHRALANNVEKLLGSARAATRPEAGATSSGQNHGMNAELFFSHIVQVNRSKHVPRHVPRILSYEADGAIRCDPVS